MSCGQVGVGSLGEAGQGLSESVLEIPGYGPESQLKVNQTGLFTPRKSLYLQSFSNES